MKFITNLSRILVGVLFIISGFIKANDPLGFSYKLDEYFVVFHTEWFTFMSLYLAIFICVFEIGLGVALLLGNRIKLNLWLLLLLIVFFTFLTFYSAYYNKVTDCGCFGDALKLTPWQSFGKDIALLVLILILFIGKSNIKPVFSEKIGSFITFLAFVASLGFGVWTYSHLPIIDFRPYKVGTDILLDMKLPPGAKTDSVQMVFIYKKDGKDMEFTVDQASNLDSTYEFVDRKDKLIRKGDIPKIHDFSITDEDNNNITEEWLSKPGYKFLLIAYDLEKTNMKIQDKVSHFSENCEKDKYLFAGLTASSPSVADSLRHAVNAMYPYYFCDATALKTMVRSNPGLALLNGSKVLAYWHYNDFPEYRDVKSNFLK
jgi:uncharacterized membrane protein YphA (DoxX/SURF4 family)